MSWGIKITILYLGFVGLILTLVIMSFQHKVDLVTPDYYGQELKFQERIDAMNNANSINEKMEVSQNENIVSIQLPSYFKKKQLSGEILFFRPSDSSKDKKVILNPSENCRQQIPATGFEKGLYKIKVDFNCEGKQYFYEEDIFFK